MTSVLITGRAAKPGCRSRGRSRRDPASRCAAGAAIRAVASDGVTPTAFSWDDPAGWPAAARGIDALYLVRPDRADAPRLVADLLAATPRAARVVLLSEREAESFPAGSWALQVEQAVRNSRHAWTVLRPSWFMQVFTDPRFHRDDLAERGRLPFAGGGGEVAWIDAGDIARVAERALLDPGHEGRAYELSGPEALTLPRTADVLSAALGRPVVHAEITIAEAVAGIEDEFERAEYVWTLERVRDGAFSGVTDTVERVTGRPARNLEQVLADAWRGGT